MLRPNCDAKEFEKYGFKRCKGIPKEAECYYLCVSMLVEDIKCYL